MKTFRQLSSTSQGVKFDFVDIIDDQTSDGQPIKRFVLATPIERKTGRTITDRTTGEKFTLEAVDVEMVSIGPDNLELLYAADDEAVAKIEAGDKTVQPIFTWIEEGKSGTLNIPTLKLDVSSNLDLWIVSEGLGNYGRKTRREAQEKQRATLKQKLDDQKTRRLMGGSNPTVTTEEKEPTPAADENSNKSKATNKSGAKAGAKA